MEEDRSRRHKKPRIDRPKSKYALPKFVDHSRLALKCPGLKQYLIAKPDRSSTLDFRNPAAVRVLNASMLRAFFELDVALPSDSLCPSVPNRLNYIKWIADNIAADFAHYSDICGIDIGTGASCIYPLLGARVMEHCSFIATDINEESAKVAKQNVDNNDLQDRVHVYLNKDRNTKLPLDAPGFVPARMSTGSQKTEQPTFAFCMCNPPFYEDEEERQKLEGMKLSAPGLDTGGKDDEFYAAGGEAGFLEGLLKESAVYRDRVGWYTTMVGKKSTLAVLKSELRAMDIQQLKEGKLIQGKTTRWVIAWSFIGKTHFSLDVCHDLAGATRWFADVCRDLEIEIKPGAGSRDALADWYMCSVKEDTWSRRARRKAKRRASGFTDKDAEEPRPVALLFKASVSQQGSSSTSRIDMYLAKGYDGGLLQSLYNHILPKAPLKPAKKQK